MNPYERVGDDGVQPTMVDVAQEAIILLDEINAEMYKRGMKGYSTRIDGIKRGFVKADRPTPLPDREEDWASDYLGGEHNDPDKG